MPKISFTESLRREYEDLFNACVIRPQRAGEVEATIQAILGNRKRYQAVSEAIGIPWHFISAVHSMEAGLDFRRHLHNGDPLTARTVQVPAGRPKNGSPPFTWEESAADALTLRRLNEWTDWSLAGTLFQIEGYNGWGYRLKHPHVLSPYLWAGSNHYTSGKYVSDGTWSDTAVSRQCGAAVILRRMAESHHIAFSDQPPPDRDAAPLVVGHSRAKSAEPREIEKAETLQRWLNTFPGVFVKVDGVPGDQTSDAYRKVTG